MILGNAWVVTMDDAGTEHRRGFVRIEDGLVAEVGKGDPPSGGAVDRVDGRDAVALPGLVNAHHHLYQVLTRVRAIDQGLFGWQVEDGVFRLGGLAVAGLRTGPVPPGWLTYVATDDVAELGKRVADGGGTVV